MKRSQDNEESNDNKKPRLNQAYNDMYSQYNLLSQCSNAQSFGQPFGQYPGSMYGMNYGTMASPYGYPTPSFFNPAFADGNRTIYLGGIPDDTPASEVLKQVKTGAVESYRALPEKRCAFLSFIEPASAHAFYQELNCKKMMVHHHEIKHGWGNSTPIPMPLKSKIHSGATRAVYLGKLAPGTTKEEVTSWVSKYGEFEDIKCVTEKSCAFVHFLTIQSATRCVVDMSLLPEWQTRRVNYAKDHCATMDMNHHGPGFGGDPYSPSPGLILRTIYIGNLQPEVKTEDICNAIRGGNVLQVRYFPEKRIAFVSFMDAATAVSVFNFANSQGLVIKGRKVKVGWGKPSSIPTPVLQAIQQGATRNVYVGGIQDSVTDDQLRKDFEEFGEIELVNLYKEKNCAFVNFTSVQSAVNAVASVKTSHPEYVHLKINYGKDRCGQAPRIRPHDSEKKTVTETKSEEAI
ncbi:hypothetical protein BY458DRAFT_450794 [Sporodiniella umbellata]|nr:hypothetical protein BY458DRAFT_450794 [Sporodiniella umbellata]